MSTVKPSSLEAKSSDEEELSSSAPIELLSEFLSALMLRDYKKALAHCKTILNYEPENKTAAEFYPIIQQRVDEIESESEDEDMKSSCSSECSWSSSSSSGEYSTVGNSVWSGSGTFTELESDAKFESMDEKDDLSP